MRPSPRDTGSHAGLLDHRAFIAAAQLEWERDRRGAQPTAVLACDIDHFALVSEDNGRAVGDEVLRNCAARWRSALRARDLMCRIEGSTFWFVLPQTHDREALDMAEQLRRLTGATPMLNGRCTVTVSIGAAQSSPDDADWANFLARAGQALHRAKAQGHDRVSSS